MSQFQPILAQSILGWRGFKICSNEGPRPFPRGDKYESLKLHLRNFKNLLLQNQWANFNQSRHKSFLDEGDSSFFKWIKSNSHKVNNFFSFSLLMLLYNHMCLMIWTVFSGEWCGPWASCFNFWILFFSKPHSHSQPNIKHFSIQLFFLKWHSVPFYGGGEGW